MSSNSYWAKREEEALKNRITDEIEYRQRIEEIYSNMLDSTEKEINAFYGRYASKENITLAEAKARVSSLDIKAYERKAKRYVKEREFSSQANEEMRLYNATMRINRLEMLKANIGLELIAGHEELNKFMGDILKGRTEDELKRQAGILGKTVKNNAQTAEAIVNSSFHNATFSNRIWLYQDLLKSNLDKLLQQGLISGKSPKALARDLKNTFDVSIDNAERLMITELARVQTEAQKQSFERNGFEEYTFLANSGCCGDCQALNGKHFKVADMMPGENAAPLHPRCRCSVAAYSDRKEYEEWLNHLENGGTTAEFEKIKAKSGKVTAPAPKAAKKGENEPKQAFNSIDLSKIDEEYAPIVENTFNGLMKDYPVQNLNIKTHKSADEFGNFKGGIKGITKNGEQYAVCDSSISISRILNKNKATSTAEHIARYDEVFSPLSKSKKVDLATIPHEYGHAIDYAYTLAKDPKLRAFAEKYTTAQKVTKQDIQDINDFNIAVTKSDKRLSKEIFDELQKEYELDYMGTVMRINQEYGSYASSSVSEFLAEGFSNMRTLDEADKTDFMKSFEKIFNRKYKEVLGG